MKNSIPTDLVMASYRHWADSEKQLLYDHLEKHKGPNGLYLANRQEAFDDFAREWKRMHSNSDSTVDSSKVFSGVKALAVKVGISSYLKLFALGPVACEKRRVRRSVSCEVTPDLEILRDSN